MDRPIHPDTKYPLTWNNPPGPGWPLFADPRGLRVVHAAIYIAGQSSLDLIRRWVRLDTEEPNRAWAYIADTIALGAWAELPGLKSEDGRLQGWIRLKRGY